MRDSSMRPWDELTLEEQYAEIREHYRSWIKELNMSAGDQLFDVYRHMNLRAVSHME